MRAQTLVALAVVVLALRGDQGIFSQCGRLLGSAASVSESAARVATTTVDSGINVTSTVVKKTRMQHRKLYLLMSFLSTWYPILMLQSSLKEHIKNISSG